MIDTLKDLCALPGVSGGEDAVRDYIRRRAERVSEDIETDVMGNLIVTKRGKRRAGKKLMLCAHMDEVGVIATNITDAGFVKFASAGGIDKRVLPGKRVFFGNISGVIGMKPVHLTEKPDREKAVDIKDMYIDIGASSKEEALKMVGIGDTGTFSADIVTLNDEYICAKAIDDRFGCAVLLKLLESELPYDCVFAFTVQEEVGTRGAIIASNRVAPDFAIIVEGTTAADLPGVSDAKRVCRLGGGAVVPFMDGGTIYDRDLYKIITNAAEKHGVAWQTKEYISGGTDAAAVQRSGIGVKTAGIAAPVRNLHSPVCIAKLSDLEAVYSLTETVLRELEYPIQENS